METKTIHGKHGTTHLPHSGLAPFITVTEGASGFFAVMMWWNPDGFWEPWDSHHARRATFAEAEIDAKAWSIDDGVEYAPSSPEPRLDENVTRIHQERAQAPTPGLMVPWVWIQPRTDEELIQRLAQARDLNVHERERENLCSVAHDRLQQMIQARDQARQRIVAIGIVGVALGKETIFRDSVIELFDRCFKVTP